MSSLAEGFEYDIFISYRRNDNRSGWVSAFVANLSAELASVVKDPVSIYFDENPHDGLLGTHHVDKSLEGKLRCLIFIPILSRTYCDPKSFAWSNEFLAFRDLARQDKFGMHVRLENRNVASRILPVQIHDLDGRDQALFEKESGGALRSIGFTFTSQGVNRPLTPEDGRADNQNRLFYRDQINQSANAIAEILSGIVSAEEPVTASGKSGATESKPGKRERTPRWVWSELIRRNVFRVVFAFLLTSLVIRQVLLTLTPMFQIEAGTIDMVIWILIGLFPFAAGLAWVFEKSPEGWIRTTSPQSAANPYRPSRKKPFTGRLLIACLFVVLVGQYVYFNYFRSGASKLNDKSIAVLPFENRSEDKGDAYIADGLTTDIVNRLYIIRQLRVISPTSSETYRNTQKGLSTIARELNVTTILTGSVQRIGEWAKISVQLRDGTNDQYLWGDTYHQKASEILAVQSEIAKQIASALFIKINEHEQASLDQRPTENYTAYDYYLKGRSLYYHFNADSNEVAIAQFRMALTIDPKFALAWAGLGDAYSQQHARFARGMNWLDSAIIAGKNAVRLDTNSSDSFKALAVAYSYLRKYDTAFLLVKKAVEKNPTNAQAVGNLASAYFLRGEYPQALRLHKRSAGLNPRGAFPFQLTGWVYRLLGDLPQAESWLTKSLELNPSFWDTYRELAFTYCSQGKTEEALTLIPQMLSSTKRDARTLEIAGRIAHFAGAAAQARTFFEESIEKNASYRNDPNSLSPIGLGQLYLDEGKKVEAEIYLAHALDLNMMQIKKGSQDDDPPFNVAAIYAIQGKKKESLYWLRAAIEKNWNDHAQVEFGPYFRQYRNDPDFKETIAPIRVKMAAMLAEAEAN
jgi:adenylate cyclase